MPPMTSPDVVVGRRIRAARRRRQMTQADLGQAAGVTFQQVQKYETAANRITVGRLAQIARGLGVPASELVDGIENVR